MSTICIFGDSIVWGAVDPKYDGWVCRLKTFIETERNFEFDVYNLGISGDKTPSLLERFESETKARTEEGEELILIFAIGINDSYFVHSKNDLMTSPERFKENIQKLITLAKNFSSKILFVGLTPIDEGKTTPIPWNTDKSYKNEYVKQYNEIVASTCKDKDIPFVEIFNKWIESDYKSLLEDGLHPNSEGHKKIFEIIKDFLIQNKVI